MTIDGNELHVRTASPDIQVAMDCLVAQEYGHICLSDVRFIVDAGAHIGASVVHFARRFPDAVIIAVEPEAENFRLLEMNTSAFPNVIRLRAALSSDRSTRQLRDRRTGNWGYSITAPIEQSTPLDQQVDCVNVSFLLEYFGIPRIDILKMDIEGGELEVLTYSDDWIDRVEVLTLETHDRIVDGCTRAFQSATRQFEFFDGAGEKVTAYRHRPDSSRHVVPRLPEF